MALQESVVHITTDYAGDHFGSGLLISDRLVLSCAHVVDSGYAARTYGLDHDCNERAAANAKTLERCRHLSIQVRLADGQRRAARLAHIHDHQDLVLLALDQPLPYQIQLPAFQPPNSGARQQKMAALGLRRVGDDDFRIRSQSASLLQDDHADSGATSSLLIAELTPGMSGGPVFVEQDGGYYCAGLNVMGSEGLSDGKILRASLLRAFLAQHFSGQQLGIGTAALSASQIGLQVQPSCLGLDDGMYLDWKRQGGNSVKEAGFLASHPLSQGHIDALFDRPRSKLEADLRSDHVAQLTASEANLVCQTLSNRLNIPCALPAMDRLSELGVGTGQTGMAPKGGAMRQRQPILPVRIGSTVEEKGFHLLPPFCAEWVRDDYQERTFLAFRQHEGAGWRSEADLSRSSAGVVRAACRPLISPKCWGMLS